MTKSFSAKIRDASLTLGFAAIVSIISTSSSFAFSEASARQRFPTSRRPRRA
jgi:hypothetical protein